MHCDVVMVGYRLNAKEPAAKALERILGVSPEVARKLARAFPSVVVEGVPEAQAEQLLEQLSNAGALVELRPRGALNVAAPRPNTPIEVIGAHPVPAGPAAAGSSGGPAGVPPPRPRLPVADFSLDLELASVPAPARSPALPRPTAGLQLPPTRAQAASPGRGAPLPTPTPSAPNYQLGDFGLARPRGPSLSGLLPISGGSVVAPLPTAPTSVSPPNPSAGGAMDLDLELGGGLELELDRSDQPGSGLRLGLSERPPDNDHHTLDDRFDELAHGAVEGLGLDAREQRARPVPRATRPSDVRRSLPPQQRVPKPEPSALRGALREWVPSLLLLAAMGAGSLAAVGYALDPSDVLGALQRERAAVSAGIPGAGSPSSHESDAQLALHPLLRATPAITRGPLAAILRARIGGVHEVPVSFVKQGTTVHCALVEHAEGATEGRLAQLRETGREVPAPTDVTAQLREHERALRAASRHPELQFTQVCLAL